MQGSWFNSILPFLALFGIAVTAVRLFVRRAGNNATRPRSEPVKPLTEKQIHTAIFVTCSPILLVVAWFIIGIMERSYFISASQASAAQIICGVVWFTVVWLTVRMRRDRPDQ
jgi:hypothetical protein